MSRATTIKKAALEKQLASLSKGYEAVSDQLGFEINPLTRSRLGMQLEDLEKQIEEVDKSLSALDSADGDNNRKHLELEQKLPRIDYEAVEKIIKEVFGERGSLGRAALFLLQNSNSLGGKWGVCRMRDLLQEAAGHFSHYPVGFTIKDRADERDILDHLAEHVKVTDRPEDLKLYAKNVIRAICGSLQGGSVVFLEVTGWNYINPQERVLKWFLDEFWIPLAREMPSITEKYRRVKIVNVLITSTRIPEDCLAPYVGAANPFDSEKVVEMPLRKWTKQEISDWLDNYSSLAADQVDNMAEQIFDSSEEGNPVLVYNALRDHFC